MTKTVRATIAASINEHRPRSGYALIILALVIEAVELSRYWLMNHPLHWQPQAIAAVIGFVGFWIRNPTEAKDAATFIIDGAGSLVGIVFRTGRRASDVKVVTGKAMDETLPPTRGRRAGEKPPQEPTELL